MKNRKEWPYNKCDIMWFRKELPEYQKGEMGGQQGGIPRGSTT